MTTDSSSSINVPSNLGDGIYDAIKRKDAESTYNEIKKFKEKMRDPEIGIYYVSWILIPANLTTLKELLVSELNISPRSLAIKRTIVSRTQRALLMVQAMEIALRRAYNFS